MTGTMTGTQTLGGNTERHGNARERNQAFPQVRTRVATGTHGNGAHGNGTPASLEAFPFRVEVRHGA